MQTSTPTVSPLLWAVLALAAQTLCRRNSYAQTRPDDIQSLTNCVRLTYGHRNSLKTFQTVNMQSARNVRNPLNRLDYNESLELANPLIIAKSANGVNRVQSVPGQNNVKRGLGVPMNIVGICGNGAVLRHEENQQHPDLVDKTRNPDSAYGKVVTESYQVARLSFSEGIWSAAG